MAATINVITEDSTVTVNVITQGAIISTAGAVSSSQLSDFIDGYWVGKASGNTAPTIEVGDRIIGWLDDQTFLAGTVNALPVSESNVTPATIGKQL